MTKIPWSSSTPRHPKLYRSFIFTGQSTVGGFSGFTGSRTHTVHTQDAGNVTRNDDDGRAGRIGEARQRYGPTVKANEFVATFVSKYNVDYYRRPMKNETTVGGGGTALKEPSKTSAPSFDTTQTREVNARQVSSPRRAHHHHPIRQE